MRSWRASGLGDSFSVADVACASYLNHIPSSTGTPTRAPRPTRPNTCPAAPSAQPSPGLGEGHQQLTLSRSLTLTLTLTLTNPNPNPNPNQARATSSS